MKRHNPHRLFLQDKLVQYQIKGYDNEINPTKILEAAVAVIRKAEEVNDANMVNKLMEARKWAIKMRNDKTKWKNLASFWRQKAWEYYKFAGAPGVFGKKGMNDDRY